MLSYAIFACLFLLASGKETLIEEIRTRFHKSQTPLPPNYFIASELLEGRETFVVLDYESALEQSPPQLRITVRKYDDHPNVQPKECTLTLFGQFNSKKLEVNEFHRLSENKTVFTWIEESSSGAISTKVIFYNIEFCNQFNFQPREFSGHAYLLPSVNESFDVLVDDDRFCRESGKRCRVIYDLNQRSYGKNMLFNVSLEWPTMHVERLASGAFLIHGYENGTFKIMQQNHLTKETVLLSTLPDERHTLDFVSNGLAYCWVRNPGVDRVVYCEMANEKYEFIYSHELHFDEPVRLIDVHTTRAEGEAFVITRKENCHSDEECWVMYGTKVHWNTTEFEHIPLYFPCTGQQKKLTVFDATPDDENRRMDLHYACRKNDSYTFSVFHIY